MSLHLKQLIKTDIDNNENNENNDNVTKILNDVGKNNRFLELDILKGIAVVLMIIFHFCMYLHLKQFLKTYTNYYLVRC